MRPVTENARFGPTRNPWNPSLSAGGSSDGSAAAVAAGMLALCDGSDLGGSIRIPASCCGLVGLKPSLGRVSIGPDFGDFTSGTVADGVLTRTVLDAATALDAIAGCEPGDRRGPLAAATAFAQATRHDPGRLRVRVALAAPGGVPVDDQPRAAAVVAAEALAGLGHDVDERAPDWEAQQFAESWTTFAAGTVQHLLRVAERLHGRPADADLLEPATRTWLVDSRAVALVDWFEASERLWAFGRRLLADWGQDELLVTPTLTRLPAEVGGLQAKGGVTDDATRFSAFVRLWNVTGQPAISLPLHRDATGVPVGVQLVGPPGRDDLVLAAAAQLEAAVGWPRVAPALEQAAV